MKIAVNTRVLIDNKLEGIGWFTYETLIRITRQHPEHQFYFLFDREPPDKFLFAPNVIPVQLHPQPRHPLLWYIWFEWRVASFLRRQAIDLFLSPDGWVSLRSRVPTVSVIHDLNFLHHRQGLPWLMQRYCEHYFPRFARHASRVVTVSEFSKADIAERLGVPPHRIDVAHNGANPIFRPLSASEREQVRGALTHGRPYFLFVGALNPRKNVSRLLRAFDLFCAQAKEKHALVIVGEKMFRAKAKEMESVYRRMTYRDCVHFTGRLPVDQLSRVMGAALALAYVPYFEGFGIPLVEAMYCHVPIIASNITAMPEVAGGAALYVDPFSVEDIASALALVASNEQMRADLSLKGALRKEMFSWDHTARRLYQSMERVMNGTPHDA